MYRSYSHGIRVLSPTTVSRSIDNDRLSRNAGVQRPCSYVAYNITFPVRTERWLNDGTVRFPLDRDHQGKQYLADFLLGLHPLHVII